MYTKPNSVLKHLFLTLTTAFRLNYNELKVRISLNIFFIVEELNNYVLDVL